MTKAPTMYVWTKRAAALECVFGKYTAVVSPYHTIEMTDDGPMRRELGYLWTIKATVSGAQKARGVQPTQDSALTACDDRMRRPIVNRY